MVKKLLYVIYSFLFPLFLLSCQNETHGYGKAASLSCLQTKSSLSPDNLEKEKMHLSLGYMYLDNRRWYEAASNFQKCCNHHDPNIRAAGYKGMYRVALETDDTLNASRYQSIIQLHDDSIRTIYQHEQLLSLHHQIETEKLKNENQQIKNRQQKDTILFLIAVATLLVLLIAAIILHYRIRYKTARQLAQTQRQIQKNLQEIERYKKDKESDHKLLSQKISQLTTKNDNLLRKLYEQEADFHEQAAILISDHVIPEDTLLILLQRIKYESSYRNIPTEKEWKQLFQLTDLVYDLFYEKISRYSSLSLNDKKYCCLFRLRIPHTDIAALFNVTPQSVTAARRRIKEKINTDKQQLAKEEILNTI